MLKPGLNQRTYFQFAILAIVAISLLACLSMTVEAKTKKAKYGTIKILTTPAGLALSVDGKAYGVTTTDYRSIDLDPGTHTIVVVLPSGQSWSRQIDLPAGRIKCVALNYRPSPPVVKSPCPFPVNVSAPTQVNEGEIITFTADVTYSGTSGLTYSWTLSPANAHVISGAGTPTITVDSTGFSGQAITATLVVDDGSADTACRQVTQAITRVPPHEKRVLVGREFDTCCSCSYDDQKARLDNLAVDLQNDPTSTAYVLAYGGRTSQIGQAAFLLSRAREYLVGQRGVDASRVVIVNGGFRESDCVELWVVPQGATPPQPTPTLQPGDVRPLPAVRPRRKVRG